MHCAVGGIMLCCYTYTNEKLNKKINEILKWILEITQVYIRKLAIEFFSVMRHVISLIYVIKSVKKL